MNTRRLISRGTRFGGPRNADRRNADGRQHGREVGEALREGHGALSSGGRIFKTSIITKFADLPNCNGRNVRWLPSTGAKSGNWAFGASGYSDKFAVTRRAAGAMLAGRSRQGEAAGVERRYQVRRLPS